MFLVLWPFVGVFGNTWTAWIAHFFFVMLVRVCWCCCAHTCAVLCFALRLLESGSAGSRESSGDAGLVKTCSCSIRYQPPSPFYQPQCDIISGGSQVNPSVSVAMFVHGAISFPGAVVRILAQLVAGIIAYPLL